MAHTISQVLAVSPEATIAATVIAFLMISVMAMRLSVLVAVELAKSFDQLLGREAGRSLEPQLVALGRLLVFIAIVASFLIAAFQRDAKAWLAPSRLVRVAGLSPGTRRRNKQQKGDSSELNLVASS